MRNGGTRWFEFVGNVVTSRYCGDRIFTIYFNPTLDVKYVYFSFYFSIYYFSLPSFFFSIGTRISRFFPPIYILIEMNFDLVDLVDNWRHNSFQHCYKSINRKNKRVALFILLRGWRLNFKCCQLERIIKIVIFIEFMINGIERIF